MLRTGAGEWVGFGAMADVDLRLSGRGAVGFIRFGEVIDGVGVEAVGGDKVCSTLGVLPLLCTEGGFEEDLGGELDSFWLRDCDLWRNPSSDVFFLRS